MSPWVRNSACAVTVFLLMIAMVGLEAIVINLLVISFSIGIALLAGHLMGDPAPPPARGGSASGGKSDPPRQD